jgi:tetratricopeptide (TPR) repeat protein
MERVFNIRQLVLNTAGKAEPGKTILSVGVLAALYFLLLFSLNEISGISPLFTVGLSWIWFLIPGWFLSYLFSFNGSWWARIPVSFALTVGMATPVTVAAILLRLDLDIFIFLHSLLLVLSGTMLIFYTFLRYKTISFEPIPEENNKKVRGDKVSFFLLAVLIVLAGVLAFLALTWPVAGDDIAGLPLFADVLIQNKITGTEPFHGSGVPVTPRNELIVLTYLEILTNKVSGVTHVDFLVHSRPFLVILALLSLAVLLEQLSGDRRQTLFLLCIWTIFLLATTQKDGTGSDLVTRVFQDKFLGWFVIVPIVLVFLVQFLERGEKSKLVGFSVVTFGASMVHPITLLQSMVLSGGFGILHLAFERNRKTFKLLIVAAIVFLVFLTVPIIQYLRYTGYMPVVLAGFGDAVEYGRMSAAIGRYRLWLLDGGKFILHPDVIMQPVILAAYLLLPVIVLYRRKEQIVQFTAGSLFLIPVLLYVPLFAALAGLVVTPYLIWRLAWPLPLFSVLAIGLGLLLLANKLESLLRKVLPDKSITGILYPGIIVFSLIFSIPTISRGVKDYSERLSEVYFSPCGKAVNVLSVLNDYSADSSVSVLASSSLNYCIPGYAGNAHVVEFRGLGTVNRLGEKNIQESIQRVEDINYFNHARLVDDILLNAMYRHNIDFVLIERDKFELDLQLNYLTSHFIRVYEDTHFRLYAAIKPVITSKVIEANTALQGNENEIAKVLFDLILNEDPSNVLANLGKGLALEGLGEGDLAILSLSNALNYAPHEPALHAQLASRYMVERDFENAIQKYKAAIQLSPDRAAFYKSLAELYILTGKNQEAVESLSVAASLRAVQGSASYYSLLGRSLQSVNLIDDAIQAHQAALSIKPEAQRHVDLGRALAASGETEKAIETVKLAVEMDRWYYLPHSELGYLYWKLGQLDKSIKEYETARRLNPTNVSAYVMLGKVIAEKFGVEKAIERLDELQEINDLLPGPYRSYAMLLMVEGEYADALQALAFVEGVQPKSSAIQIAKGYILLNTGNVDDALKAFHQALVNRPDFIPAQLGLQMYYRYKADYRMEVGQLHKIIRLAPTAAWPHLLLSEAHQRAGKYNLALEEIDLAIKLQPADPIGYLARAAINKRLYKWEHAISDYLIALDLDPTNFDALIDLGDIYTATGRPAEAEKAYLSAEEIGAVSASQKIQLAEVYRKLGRQQEAASIEKEVLTSAPDDVRLLIQIAKGFETQGDIEEARSIYQRVIEVDQSIIAGYFALAQLLEENNDLDLVYSLYASMLYDNPGSSEAHLAAGRFFMKQGQFQLAEHVLKISLTYPEVSIENYLVLCELQLRLGEKDEALKTLNTVVNIFSRNPAGYVNLARFYMSFGDYEQGEMLLDRAIELEAGYILSYLERAKIKFQNGYRDEAEAILQDTISKYPGSIEAVIALANHYESVAKLGLAENNFRRAIEMRPLVHNGYIEAARFFIRQKNYTDALILLEQALSLPGSKLEIYLELGNLDMARNQPKEAAKWYQAANLEDLSDIRPYLGHASLSRAAGKFEEAIHIYTTALEIEPVNVPLNLEMGRLLKMMNRIDEARAYFERAYEVDLGRIEALVELGNLSRDQGNLIQAISFYEMAIQISPTDLSGYLGLSNTYLLLDDTASAESILSTSIQRTTDKEAAYIARAQYYEKQGRWDHAFLDYQMAWSNSHHSKSAGIKLVDYLRRRNEIEQAIIVLKELEHRYGQGYEISNEYGKIYATQGRWSLALKAYQAAISADPTAVSAYLGLAAVYKSQGALDEMIYIFNAAAVSVVDKGIIYNELGKILQEQGKYEEAWQAYHQAVELDPWKTSALLHLEQLNTIMQRPDLDLLDYVRQALLIPSDRAFIVIGQIYQQRGEWTLAYSWYQKAVLINPYNEENWLILGHYYISLHQWQNALDAYERGSKFEKNSIEIGLALGSAHEAMGSYDEAEVIYQRITNINPTKIDGYIALAKLQLLNGASLEALETIQEGITHSPVDFRGYKALGDIYLAIDPEKNFALALEAYATGLEISPGATSIHIQIGITHTNIVKIAWQALNMAKNLERSAEIRYFYFLSVYENASSHQQQSQDMLEILQGLERQYDKQHKERITAQVKYQQCVVNIEAAEESLFHALYLEPNNEVALIGMGNLMLVSRRENLALEYFEQAYASNSYSIISLIELGNIYLSSGRVEEAVKIFERIIMLDPENVSGMVRLTNAYPILAGINPSQAAYSVEYGAFKLQTLVKNIRKREASR